MFRTTSKSCNLISSTRTDTYSEQQIPRDHPADVPITVKHEDIEITVDLQRRKDSMANMARGTVSVSLVYGVCC